MKKIVVAPQIVIYQNIFTKNKEFIDFLYANWRKVIGNGYMSEIKGIYDSRGIVGYTTKKISITDAMSLDVHSSHINAAD